MGWWDRLFGGSDPPPTWLDAIRGLLEAPPRLPAAAPAPPTDEDIWRAACLMAEHLVARHEAYLRRAGIHYNFVRRFQDLDSRAVVEIHVCDPHTLAEHHPQGLSSEICIGHYRGRIEVWTLGGPLPTGRTGRDQHALGHALTHYLDQAEGGPAHNVDADRMWEGCTG